MSSISTQVRVDSYTNVHTVTEFSDGKLYVVKTYVKASGSCSAPAGKTADKSSIGQIRLRQFAKSADGAASKLHEARVIIRHPNDTGFQMDQDLAELASGLFRPSVNIWQGRNSAHCESSISISKDPDFRRSPLPDNAKSFVSEDDRHGRWCLQGDGATDTSQM